MCCIWIVHAKAVEGRGRSYPFLCLKFIGRVIQLHTTCSCTPLTAPFKCTLLAAAHHSQHHPNAHHLQHLPLIPFVLNCHYLPSYNATSQTSRTARSGLSACFRSKHRNVIDLLELPPPRNEYVINDYFKRYHHQKH